MKKTLLAIFFVTASLSLKTAMAQTLVTENYIIEIKNNCAEGVVVCDDITYIGTSKTSGNHIELSGQTHHVMCADGVTPCRFLGYIFENGNVTYFVDQAGAIKVTQNETVLVEETGEWVY
ncbi:hypothetical protein [Billgrantia aerodenitrificans]|nr:hypothetical protein [Halomonas aerodenitrificans]